MMRRLLPFLLVLAGCAPAPTEILRTSHRDPSAIIASKADFDAAAFAGAWHEVARFPGTPGCAGAKIAFAERPGGLIRTTRCADGSQQAARIDVAPLGRLSVVTGAAPTPLWVLWTDTGYRTAIVVAPDGTAGQILNRAPAVPVDRLRASLEVLDFNGFRTDRLIFN